MSAYLVLFVGIIYAAVAYDQASKHAWPDVLIWTGYAAANAGFCLKYLSQ